MQRHIIKTQIMEIQIPSKSKAFEMQNRVSATCRNRLVPVLDRVCSELSGPEGVHRIDRLELDIGRVFHNFSEQSFADKIEDALRTELAKAMGRAGCDIPVGKTERQRIDRHGHGDGFPCGTGSPVMEEFFPDESFPWEATEVFGGMQERNKSVAEPETSAPRMEGDAELSGFFLQTGVLPWWSDKSEGDVAVKAMERLISKAPADAREIIGEVFSNHRHLQRMILQFSDSVLERLIPLLIPAADDSQGTLSLCREALGILHPGCRERVWRCILYGIVARDRGVTTRERMAEDILLHAMGAENISVGLFFRNVLKKVRELGEQGFEFKSEIVTVAENLLERMVQTDYQEDKKEGEESNQVILEDRESQGEKVQEPSHHDPQPDLFQDGPLKTPVPMPEIPRTKEFPFSDAEAIHVNNSGLVLLYEFLQDFFQKNRLGEG